MTTTNFRVNNYFAFRVQIVEVAGGTLVARDYTTVMPKSYDWNCLVNPVIKADPEALPFSLNCSE